MKCKITKNDIDYALAPSPWGLGNEILYSLCKKYPRHVEENAIIAKMWLIGRAYAAAIERRKEAQGTTDQFYQTTVVQTIKGSKLDKWLKGLPKKLNKPWDELGLIITVHKQLIDIISPITKLNQRSLASKYLHFHRPDLFFIYDSRAKKAINKVTPCLNKTPKITAKLQDSEYHAFCRRAQYLKDNIKKRFDKDLNPRQLDNILLRIESRTRLRKNRTGNSSVQ